MDADHWTPIAIAFLGLIGLLTPAILTHRMSIISRKMELEAERTKASVDEAKKAVEKTEGTLAELTINVDGRLQQLLEQVAISSHAAGMTEERERPVSMLVIEGEGKVEDRTARRVDKVKGDPDAGEVVEEDPE